MPFQADIVKSINAFIKTNVLNDERFGKAQIYGITYPITLERNDATITIPCVWDDDYSNAEPIEYDDSYPLTMYHCIAANQYQTDLKEGYGDAGALETCTTILQMVIAADMKQIRVTPDELEAVITSGFPVGKEAGFLVNPLRTLAISIVDSNLDPLRVFAEQFKGLPYKPKAGKIFLSIRYKIESRYKKGCFRICDCASA
jgi:hypothetical protein